MIEEKVNSNINSSLSQRLIKNSFYTGLALAFVGIIPFAFNFLVARTFGREILGTINISLSFCLIITIFVTNFFGSSGNKYLAEYRGRNNLEQFTFVFKIMFIGPIIILSIIGIILALNWDYFSQHFSLSPNLFFTLLSYIFLRSFYILIRRALYGIDLVRSYAMNEIISAVIMLIALVYVCYSGQSSFLVECYVLCYALFCFLGIKTFIGNFDSITKKMVSSNDFDYKKIIKEFSNYGLVSMIGTVASTSTGYISVIIIGMYLNHSDAGLYSSVLSIASVLMFVPKLFTQVFLPEFSKLFGEGNKQKIFQIFNQTNTLMLGLSAMICLIVFLFADDILSVFGKEFSNGSLILKIILPSIFIRMISIPFVSFLSGTKYVLYPNIGGIFILLISTICWILLVPKYQLIGIAIGYTTGIIIGIGYQIFVAIIKIRSFDAIG